MKFALKDLKPTYMLAIIFTLIISCATFPKISHREIPIDKPQVTITADGMPYIPLKIKQDTLSKARRDQIEYRKRIDAFMKRMEDKADETYSDVHSVRDLNVLLQTQLLDLTQRLSIRRDQIDSLSYRLKSIQDTVNLSKTLQSKYYKEAKQANYYREQYKKSSAVTDWMTYAGAIFFGLIMLAILIMQGKISRQQKKLLYD